MFKLLNLLLLLGLFNHSETVAKLVTGIKGGSVTLKCELKAKDIAYIHLSRSKSIYSCQNEKCESESEIGQVFKRRSCDIIIKNLRLSDAGKYFLRVYYKNDQTEVEQQILEYQLCIHDDISVKKGEELKLDVLLINADKVVHWLRRSTWPKEDWSRSHGVINDRMTIKHGKLIINNFTATDSRTYGVLDSEGEILIMVTVSESRTESVDKMSYN